MACLPENKRQVKMTKSYSLLFLTGGESDVAQHQQQRERNNTEEVVGWLS